MLPTTPSLARLAEIIQLAVAPVFLLAGLGAFLNVCVSRLARIVDRMRAIEPRILSTRGEEHDRLVDEARLLDRRTRVVTRAIFLTVLSATLICAVVSLIFLAFLTKWKFGTAIAVLFIVTMACTATAFATFLHETRLGVRAVRARAAILEHRPEERA